MGQRTVDTEPSPRVVTMVVKEVVGAEEEVDSEVVDSRAA